MVIGITSYQIPPLLNQQSACYLILEPGSQEEVNKCKLSSSCSSLSSLSTTITMCQGTKLCANIFTYFLRCFFICLHRVLVATHGIFCLPCGMQNLPCCCGMQLLVAACGTQFPDQGSNLGHLPWEHGVLPLDCQGSPYIFTYKVCVFPNFKSKRLSVFKSSNKKYIRIERVVCCKAGKHWIQTAFTF